MLFEIAARGDSGDQYGRAAERSRSQSGQSFVGAIQRKSLDARLNSNLGGEGQEFDAILHPR
jgi:hypothetical protein